MLDVETTEDLRPHLGQTLGVSDWLTVDQAMINAFADATGDHQWIHVDTARAARDMPGGTTIAHGFLTLSLLPTLGAGIWNVRHCTQRINYGLDRLRFLTPVPSGSRVRLQCVLRGIEPGASGVRVRMEQTVEIEGHERPALVAETITLIVGSSTPTIMSTMRP